MVYDILSTIVACVLFPITWLWKIILKLILGRQKYYACECWSQMVKAILDVTFHPSHIWNYNPSRFTSSQHKRLLQKIQKNPQVFSLAPAAENRLRFVQEWLLKAVDHDIPEMVLSIESHPSTYAAIRNVSRLTLWPTGIQWLLRHQSEEFQDFIKGPFEHPKFKDTLATYGVDVDTYPGWSQKTLSYLNSKEFARCQHWVLEHQKHPQPGWYYLQHLKYYDLSHALHNDDPFDDGSVMVWPELTSRLDTMFPLHPNWCWSKILALYGVELVYEDMPVNASQSLIDALYIARNNSSYYKYEWLNKPASIDVDLWLHHPAWITMTGWERCIALQDSTIHSTEEFSVNGLLG